MADKGTYSDGGALDIWGTPENSTPNLPSIAGSCPALLLSRLFQGLELSMKGMAKLEPAGQVKTAFTKMDWKTGTNKGELVRGVMEKKIVHTKQDDLTDTLGIESYFALLDFMDWQIKVKSQWFNSEEFINSLNRLFLNDLSIEHSETKLLPESIRF